MTKAEFIAWATSRGWTQDKWGHLHSKGGNYRFKLSSIAVRYERKTGLGWVRIASNFFSRVSISPEGKLTGLLAHGCGSDKPASAEAIMGALYGVVSDSIGFMLATGKTFDEIRTWCKEWKPTLIEVADFLEANYDVKVWYERGRR